jgi:hypothetical protein
MRCHAVFAATVLLLLGSCDRATRTYATLEDARKDRLFERGWLPDILPPSSRAIRVSSDLDTNRSEGEFSFDPVDFAAFTARLSPTADQRFQYSADSQTWIFSCDPSRGHCRYSSR